MRSRTDFKTEKTLVYSCYVKGTIVNLDEPMLNCSNKQKLRELVDQSSYSLGVISIPSLTFKSVPAMSSFIYVFYSLT